MLGFIVEVRELGETSGRTIRVRNGSNAKANIEYHSARLDKIIPRCSDVLYVSIGHKQKEQAAKPFVTNYAAFVDAALAIIAGGVVVSQNPEIPPYGLVSHHESRLAALRTHAVNNGGRVC